jgi:hypothetical protein
MAVLGAEIDDGDRFFFTVENLSRLGRRLNALKFFGDFKIGGNLGVVCGYYAVAGGLFFTLLHLQSIS